MEREDYIVVWNKSDICIKKVIRQTGLNNAEMIKEAKIIAAKEIGCNYVDGLNFTIGKKCFGGIYCDELAAMTKKHYCNLKMSNRELEVYGPVVIINEKGGLEPYECEEIKQYIVDNMTIK